MQAIAALIVILALPNGGHVWGDAETKIGFRWAIEDHAVDATAVWQLTLGELVLEQGELPLTADGASLTLKLPGVRVMTLLDLHYEIHGPNDVILGRGQARLWLHPDLDVGKLAESIDSTITHVEAVGDPGLVALLESMGLKVQTVGPDAGGQIIVSPWVIVGRGALTPSVERSMVRALQRGAKVVVLAQDRWPDGPQYVERSVTKPSWNRAHPLLGGVESKWLNQRVETYRTLSARRLLPDDNVHAVGGWPHPEAEPVIETEVVEKDQANSLNENKEAASSAKSASLALLDAILWTQRDNKGVVVGWHVPVADWSADPVAANWLANAILYLAYPPPLLTPSGN